MFLLFHRTGPRVTSPVVSSRQGVIQVFVDFSQENLNEKKSECKSLHIHPWVPASFFLSSFLKFHSPFLSPHLNAGRRLTFFNLSRCSSIYWMSWLAFGLALISNFSSTIYHFLLFRCSSICWMKFRTQNAREEYQNNTPTTSMSILSRFVRLGSLLFFSASSMLALFLLAFSFLLAFLLSFHLKQARLGSFLSARSYIFWDEEAEI